MTDLVVKEGTTARVGAVDGNLSVGKNARITSESGTKVVVSGAVTLAGGVSIDCNFECKSMKLEGRGWGPAGDVRVRGDLIVHESANLDASVRVDGKVRAGDLDVAGHLRSGSLASKRLRVGGHLTTEGSLRAEEVDVGGHMTVAEEVRIAGLRVGGHAEIGGGEISGEIRVRGHFTTTKKLVYGQVQVYGHLRLPAGSSGAKLVAHGKVEFEGDAMCRVIEIDGAGSVRGSCNADSVKINGTLGASGPLRVSDQLEVYGTAQVRGELECGSLSVGGKLAANSVTSAGRADIAGEVWTSRGLKAQELRVGTGSRVNGPMVGETVEIGAGVDLGGFWASMANLRSMGRMTKVDDVWGKEVRIARYSQAKRVYGEVVRMKSGSVAEEVNYTREVDVPTSAHLESGPKKIDRIPDPPL